MVEYVTRDDAIYLAGLFDGEGCVQFHRRYKGKKGDPAKKLIWKILSVSAANGSMMGCSAFGSTEGEIVLEDMTRTGVLGGHAYSIIDVIEIDVKNEGKEHK